MIFRAMGNPTPEIVYRPAKCDSEAHNSIIVKLLGNFMCFPPPLSLSLSLSLYIYIYIYIKSAYTARKN